MLSALHEALDRSARRYPSRPALEEAANVAVTYGELARLSNRLRDWLYHVGVRPGDRVGVYLHKSIDAVAAIFGILKAGAAYVPVDPDAPVDRNAYILSDCTVKAVVVEQCVAARLCTTMASDGNTPRFLTLQETGGGTFLWQALERKQDKEPSLTVDTIIPSPDDLAYILYTSGSTGKPKGVTLSHRNAISFIDWCSEAFQPRFDDRFASHAPLHFDLSILDLYLSMKHGATLVLIGEELAKNPAQLARLLSEKRISVWYSTPSILSMMTQYGKLERYDHSHLRLILFAGEVFPVKYLQALKTLLPAPRYVNLYGPTETNVCTFYDIPTHIPKEQTRPFPIGRACQHASIRVVDIHGQEVPTGQEGELWVSGPGVMQGYWDLPQQSASAFFTDPSGQRWYRTGDIVIRDIDTNLHFVGRRDRMVKKRGYRVELQEIEAGLYGHPAVQEAAVIAVEDDEQGLRTKAFISCQGLERPSIIELKRFCAAHLPGYMVPDLFSFQPALPKTSTDKIDYQKLQAMT